MEDKRLLVDRLETLPKDAFNLMALKNFTADDLRSLQQTNSTLNDRIKRFETWRYLFAERFPEDYAEVMGNRSKYNRLVKERQMSEGGGDFWKKIYEARLRFGAVALLEPNMETRTPLQNAVENPFYIQVDSSGRYVVIIAPAYLVYMDIVTKLVVSRFNGNFDPSMTTVAADSLVVITQPFGGPVLYDRIHGERPLSIAFNLQNVRLVLNQEGDRVLKVEARQVVLYSLNLETADVEFIRFSVVSFFDLLEGFQDVYFVGPYDIILVGEREIRGWNFKTTGGPYIVYGVEYGEKIVATSMSWDRKYLWVLTQIGRGSYEMLQYEVYHPYTAALQKNFFLDEKFKLKFTPWYRVLSLPRWHDDRLPLLLPGTNKVVSNVSGKYEIFDLPWPQALPRAVAMSREAPIILWTEIQDDDDDDDDDVITRDLVIKSFSIGGVLVSSCIQCQTQPAQYTSKTKGGEYCSIGCYMVYHA